MKRTRGFCRACAVLVAAMLALTMAGCGASDETETKGTEQNVAETENKAEETTITILPDAGSPFADGAFEGWGTSFCWWANRLGYSDTLAEQAAALFYDKEEGLGLNIVRYNIGGGDDPEHNHITRTDSAVPGYLVYDKESDTYTYDWTADANQRNVLLKAQAVCDPAEFIVEGFSNSAPYFMTESGCSTGGIDPNEDNLKEEYVDAFAEYLAEVTLHFKNEWGVPFQSVSPMNEPYTDYWPAFSWKQEGCHFDQGDSQSNMLLALNKALTDKGLSDVLIVGTDETSIDTQIDSYNRLSQAAKDVLDRIDTHTYGGSNRAGLRLLAEQEGKNLWMSEVDGGDTAGVSAGEMGAALWLAQRIITDMNGMKPSAWIMWQVIDNHISEEGYNGNVDSGMINRLNGYWGIAVADHDQEKILLSQKYYAFGQFSRYIRPGAQIIGVDRSEQALAAYDPEQKQLIIVAINTEYTEKQVAFDLSGFSAVGTSALPIRTSGNLRSGESWTELETQTVDGTTFHTALKGNSITTFIIDGVEK